MSLAYQDTSAEELSDLALDTEKARRKHLFKTYVARMFKRRGSEQPYDDEETKKRLAWLAWNMQRHNQEVFLIESLQPSWLQARRWRWAYALASRLIGVLSIGLAFGLTFLLFAGPSLGGRLGGAGDYGLMFGLALGMSFGLVAALFGGLFIGLIDILRFELFGKATDIIPKFWGSVINVLIIWLLLGPTCGVCTLAIIPTHGPFFTLVLGLIFGPRGNRQSLTYDIQTVEALRWSWGKALKGGIIGALAGGLTVILIGGFFLFSILNLFVVFDADFPTAGLSDDLVRALYFLFLSGIIGGLVGGLIGTIFGGLSRDIIEAKTVPNQGIRLSARNAIFGGLAVGLIGGLILELSGRLLGWEWMSSLLLPGLILGLAFGLLGTLWYGGLDLIQHYTLRLILIIQGHTPRNYARFLDYSTNLIFLQKVGGGYRFIHRLLLEHFAELEPEQ